MALHGCEKMFRKRSLKGLQPEPSLEKLAQGCFPGKRLNFYRAAQFCRIPVRDSYCNPWSEQRQQNFIITYDDIFNFHI